MKRQSKPLCSYQNVEFRGRSLCSAAHAVLLLWLAGGLSACHKADRDAPYPRHLLWGDTQVHSKLSMDAHIYGNTHLGPDAAYRFAKGERVDLPGGGQAVLKRPLDFLVVADHAEYLGVRVGLSDGNPDLLETETGRHWHHHMTAAEGDPSVPLLEFAASLAQGTQLIDTPAFERRVWEQVVAYAEAANEPGVFTALIGYEWSAMPGGNNLHRVVVFADGAEKVLQHQPFSALDSPHPEDLWQALAAYERQTGGRVLSIPHNPNLSGGRMFAPLMSNGAPFDADYARTRAHFERLLEVTQVKGDSETHPFLSPDDEFADFERWDRSNVGMIEPHREEWFKGEYAREALKTGLKLQAATGINPFQFGMIGSTDQHNSLPDVAEDNFSGKFTVPGRGPDRWSFTVGPETLLPQVYYEWELAAAGYAGVWAHENTRAAIFDALRRRETFATTGPRIALRFFVGTDFPDDLLERDDWVEAAYRHGHPMGADIELDADETPLFVVEAHKDPQGADLDRVQIIKGWLDKDGQTHEAVYDLLPSRQNAAGRIRGYWHDPAYVPGELAFYYARALEIATPRWTTRALARHPTNDVPSDVPRTIQERAYTSPIWVRPAEDPAP